MKKLKVIFVLLLCLLLLFLAIGVGIDRVSAASNPDNAPLDWAFDASSVELNDAIIENHPELDSGDGFITISAANEMTGYIDVSYSNASYWND